MLWQGSRSEVQLLENFWYVYLLKLEEMLTDDADIYLIPIIRKSECHGLICITLQLM